MESEALHIVVGLYNGEHDAEAWVAVPSTDDEGALDEIADWGPAEDWSDWVDAAR